MSTSMPLDPEICFTTERPRLVGLAYRLLGSISDAEDVVQEAWVRWNRADHPSIENPAAWLTTVTSRLGLDRLRARQRDRAVYVGPWLPEPLVSFDDQPAAAAELSDSLTTAFLVMMENLAPTERLVLLLADVFQQPFAVVAEVVAKSQDATRQIAVRARRKVRSNHDIRVVSADEQLAAANKFVAALLGGNQAALRELLSTDAVLTSDGGADHHAARRPVVGPDRIARFLTNLAKRAMQFEPGRMQLQSGWVNHAPGLIATVDGQPTWVSTFDMRDGQIDRLYLMVNPDKLSSVEHPTDLV
ncbi:MAG: RNA polymerase sigma factor SigJ [Ilumatobacteraceae bacterium]